jgi:hypothetical protein
MKISHAPILLDCLGVRFGFFLTLVLSLLRVACIHCLESRSGRRRDLSRASPFALCLWCLMGVALEAGGRGNLPRATRHALFFWWWMEIALDARRWGNIPRASHAALFFWCLIGIAYFLWTASFFGRYFVWSEHRCCKIDAVGHV